MLILAKSSNLLQQLHNPPQIPTSESIFIMAAVMAGSEPFNFGGKANTAPKEAAQKLKTTTLEEAEKNVPVGKIFQKPSNSDSNLFSSSDKPSTGLFGGSAKAPVNFISSSEKATIQAMSMSTSNINAAKTALSTSPATISSKNSANTALPAYLSNAILLTAEEITAVFGQPSTTSGAPDPSVSIDPIPSASPRLSSSDSSSKSGIPRDIELGPFQAPRSSATSTPSGPDDLSGKLHELGDAAQYPVASKPSGNTSQGTESYSGGQVSRFADTFGLSYRNRTRSQLPNNPSNGFSSAMAGYFNDATRISGIPGDYTGSQAPKMASGAGSLPHFSRSSGTVGTPGGNQISSNRQTIRLTTLHQIQKTSLAGIQP
ncbi:hypothetical protein BDZ45DRAFT_415817 [Acephala macrosclerotiorum]|nr:hypothetical protein BDZ45DRAFT_415817 [Acephala macrosclerotiorum]